MKFIWKSLTTKIVFIKKVFVNNQNISTILKSRFLFLHQIFTAHAQREFFLQIHLETKNDKKITGNFGNLVIVAE